MKWPINQFLLSRGRRTMVFYLFEGPQNHWVSGCFSIQLHSTAAILFCAKVFERYQIAAIMELPCYIPYFLAFLLIVLRFPLISLVFLCSSRIFFSCSFVSCMFFPSSFHVPFISLSCPFISFHALHSCISFSWFWSVLISFHFDWMSFALFSVSISSNHVHSIVSPENRNKIKRLPQTALKVLWNGFERVCKRGQSMYLLVSKVHYHLRISISIRVGYLTNEP